MSRSKWLLAAILLVSFQGRATEPLYYDDDFSKYTPEEVPSFRSNNFFLNKTKSSERITGLAYQYENPKLPIFTQTEVRFEDERLILTASLIHRGKPSKDYLYGGSFSPSAGISLKPFRNSRLRAFTQASCLDYYCNSILVSFGIRTSPGNPYATREPKFVLSKIGEKMRGYN